MTQQELMNQRIKTIQSKLIGRTIKDVRYYYYDMNELLMKLTQAQECLVNLSKRLDRDCGDPIRAFYDAIDANEMASIIEEIHQVIERLDAAAKNITYHKSIYTKTNHASTSPGQQSNTSSNRNKQ